jgi:hypothetical protein
MAANGGGLLLQNSRSREVDLHTNESPDSMIQSARSRCALCHRRCDVPDFGDILRSILHLTFPQLIGNDGAPCVGGVVLSLSERASIG